MSTNAIIANTDGNGKHVSTYVHWDGYIGGVGKTLLEHYNEMSAAFDICRVGYISALMPTIDETRKEAINKEPTKHTYSNEQFEKYLDEFCSIEWVYLYDESQEQWFVKHVNHWDEYAPLNEFGINIVRGEYVHEQNNINK